MSLPIPEEVARIFASAPFIASLGLQLESAGGGECRTFLPLENRHLQQDGFVHAGVQATVADHTAGAAAASLLAAGQLVLSIEFKINLLTAARGESLRCHARVLKAGSRITVVESDVFCVANVKESLVSKAIVTLAVITPRKEPPSSSVS